MKTENKKAKILCGILLAVAVAVMALFPLLQSFAAESATGTVNQNISHAEEASMYPYTLLLSVNNPINVSDCDEDALCDLWFTFTYKGENGYGASKKYTLDMSWKNGRNQNANYVKLLQRKNDNAYKTAMQVWVPGIVSCVDVHLNMDGGERLNFAVEGVFLNDFRANTDTDYVSSAYYDSEAVIHCRLPAARVMASDGVLCDCYGGVAGEKLQQLYAQSPEKYGYER